VHCASHAGPETRMSVHDEPKLTRVAAERSAGGVHSGLMGTASAVSRRADSMVGLSNVANHSCRS
jgi:hypothetical protein